MQGQQFVDGATVYDIDGEKVGTLRAYDPQGGYLTVEKGFLFHKDFYVPMTRVQGVDADGDVHLSLRKDDLSDIQYDAIPAAPLAGGAYGQTMTTTETTTTRPRATPVPTPAPAPARPSMAKSDETIAVPVYEEELVVGKQQVEQGAVHLRKDVVAEKKTVNVSLQQEQVTVERVPFTGELSQEDLKNAFQGRDIEVPVMGQEAVVGKETHLVEEVRLHKDAVVENEQVTDTVRKERVTIEGDVSPTQTSQKAKNTGR